MTNTEKQILDNYLHDENKRFGVNIKYTAEEKKAISKTMSFWFYRLHYNFLELWKVLKKHLIYNKKNAILLVLWYIWLRILLNDNLYYLLF